MKTTSPYLVSFFLLVVFIPLNALGSIWQIQQSPLSIELQQPTVSAIFRDRSGLLWIGTQHGLYVFNGSEHSLYSHASERTFRIPDSDILQINQRENGRVTVVTSSGKLLQSNSLSDSFQIVAIDPQNKNLKVLNVLHSKTGSTYIITNDGLYLWQMQSISKVHWIGNNFFSTNRISAKIFVHGGSDYILMGIPRKLILIGLKERTIKSLAYKSLGLPQRTRITAIETARSGLAVMATSDGELLTINLKTGGILSQRRILHKESLFVSAIILQEETLVVATDRGLFTTDLSLDDFESIRKTDNQPTSPDIYTLYQDRGKIWVGTGSGLDIISFASTDFFNDHTSGVFNDVLSFSQDSEGILWVGTYSGLFAFNEANGLHSKTPIYSNNDSIRDHRVTALHSDSDQLWIGHLRGKIIVRDTKTEEIKELDLGNETVIAARGIVGSLSDQVIWIATQENGLIRLTKNGENISLESNLIPEKSIHAIFKSTQGTIFAATDERIYKNNSKIDFFEELVFDYDHSDIKPAIYSFAQTKYGDILIGTKNQGLYSWSMNDQRNQTLHLKKLTRESSISSSIIYGIQIDNDDNIWCSTQNGIVKLDPNGKLIKRFTKADGLQGNDFNLGASFKDRRGRIYFGGANGYNRFDPSTVPTATEPSPMMLTGVTVPGGRINNIHLPSGIPTLELSHRDDSISFHFSVLDFTAPEKNEYRYKLVNFDNQWINNRARNTATYTDLPSGDYTFLVQGANSSGTWNTEGISVNVRKRTTPWLSWWAFYIYGLLGAITVWACFRIYKSYAIERHSLELATQLYETESEADDDFHEFIEIQSALATAARAHSKSTLDIIEYCITSQRDEQTSTFDRKLADGSVKRINVLSRLKQYTRYEPESVQINLHSFVDATVSDLLQITEVRPESIITINDIEDDYLSSAVATPLGIILFELLENIFLHAFTAASPANYIHLQLNIEESCQRHGRSVHLSVQDSGRGFPQDMLKACEAMSGLAIVQAIIRRLGGNIKFGTDSSAHISIIIPAIPDHR